MTPATSETRFALLEEAVHRHEMMLYGADGESGMSGRMRAVERFQARVGGMAALGAVLGGVIVALIQQLLS